MKNKYQISYINLFENFKLILREHNISIDNNKIYLMADYESVLRNALKICFPNCNILGCFFHYLQCMLKKIKELGLLKKHLVLNVYKLLFFFKLYPFLLPNDKTEFLNFMIENYMEQFNNNNENYRIIKLFIYFVKNWYGSKTIDFIIKTNNIFNFRTNNTVEWFNLYLNNIVEHLVLNYNFFLRNKNYTEVCIY